MSQIDLNAVKVPEHLAGGFHSINAHVRPPYASLFPHWKQMFKPHY